MITAAQAKQATLERINTIAKEFIINNVGVPVQQAIDNGHFFAPVSFENVPSPEITGAEVVRLLEEQGFQAEHIYYDGPGCYDNYILIKWED